MAHDIARFDVVARTTRIRRLRRPSSSVGLPVLIAAVLTVAIIGEDLTCGRGGASGTSGWFSSGDCGGGGIDARILGQIQRLDLPIGEGVLRSIAGALNPWTMAAGWAVTMLALAWRRWWSSVVVMLLTALGIGAVALLEWAVVPSEPLPAEVGLGVSGAPSWPITVLLAASLLVGAIAVVMRSHMTDRRTRLATTAIAGVVVVGAAWELLRLGWLWPFDVALVVTLGAVILLPMPAIQRRLADDLDGLPLIHAGFVSHDEALPHAHALTSTILFEGERVLKIYRPGIVPRAIYWSAFQAPFGYEHSETALRAAVLRRNLAGRLTEHWFGASRVAPALGVERVGGRLAIVGEFVPGGEPHDHAAARSFLHDLSDRFDEAGLPTWQIDPRQPRSLGNVLERPDGSFMIIDLESGLVSPLASPRAWARAFRRGLVPFYDDVYFDLTRSHIERSAPAIRATHGDAWLTELFVLLAQTEAATAAWHAEEPRVWSWLVTRLTRVLHLAPSSRAVATPKT